MKIIILGAGQVGSTLAAQLVRENIDIVMVDSDPAVLLELRSRLDIQTLEGMASHPNVLRQAGAEDADMVVAVTNSDEVNMVACQVSYSLFRTPMKIARIRASAYTTRGKFFSREHMPIDVLINPDQLVTNHIQQLIRHPGSLQVLDFAQGRVQLVAVKAYADGPLAGQTPLQLYERLPDIDIRIVAIFRKSRGIIPNSSTTIKANDEVFFIAASKHIDTAMEKLRGLEHPYKRIIIAGGGNRGSRLAQALDANYSVKIIEPNISRCSVLSETLDRAVVLHGDATSANLLMEEGIESTDVFCTLTNDDETNILASMLARQLGARKVMTMIGKPAYVELIQGGAIDVAISSHQEIVSEVLAHIRRGDVSRVHSLRRGAAEAIEAVAHGSARLSRVVGRPLKEVKLPPGTSIGAIVRGKETLITNDHNIVVQADDHLILFLADKNQISEIEKLFQVGLHFF